MKTHLVIFTFYILTLTHIIFADESTSPQERYKKMYAQSQEEVKSLESELLANYEKQPHPTERLEAEKDYLVARIEKLELRIKQCMEGTIPEEIASGCEKKDFYMVLHTMKMLLGHIEQKIAAQQGKINDKP